MMSFRHSFSGSGSSVSLTHTPLFLLTRTYFVALSFSLSLLRRALITSLRSVSHPNLSPPYEAAMPRFGPHPS